MKENIKYSIIIICSFCLSIFGSFESRNLLGLSIENEIIKNIYFYGWWVIPSIIITGILFSFSKICYSLGLSQGFLKGLFWGFIFALPMIIGYTFIGELKENYLHVVIKSLKAGFFEEFLFRGFLFGLLFRKLKWGFFSSAALGAFIFGCLHIYQGNSAMQSLGIFMVTAMGALWFAWLYIEWESNLWLPIFLHFFMNLAWGLFSVSDSGALGGYSSNIFRVSTILISVMATLYFCKKRNRFFIPPQNFWKQI